MSWRFTKREMVLAFTWLSLMQAYWR
jgi:hypothetical protein